MRIPLYFTNLKISLNWEYTFVKLLIKNSCASAILWCNAISIVCGDFVCVSTMHIDLRNLAFYNTRERSLKRLVVRSTKKTKFLNYPILYISLLHQVWRNINKNITTQYSIGNTRLHTCIFEAVCIIFNHVIIYNL